MANIFPMGRSAWFSSSVPKSKVENWVKDRGRVEPDPFQADFLFSENDEAPDIQRIFESEEYLAGRLVVFHSDFIIPAGKKDVVTNMDIKSIILPCKELDKLGISLVQCSGNNRSVNTTNRELIGRSEKPATSNKICTSTPKDSENQAISRKYATQDEVSSNTRKRMKIISPQQSVGGGSFEDCISEFSPTPDKSAVAKTSQTKSSRDGSRRNCGMFYHSLNFDITHLDDISVPRVQLMDFIPGVDGACHVEKKKTKLHGKHK